MEQVNLNSKIYNTTPTPSPQLSATAPPSSAHTSSISSPSSGSSISNFCHTITSWVHSGWKWFKEKILRIRPEVSQSTESGNLHTPVYVYDPNGSILTNFKNACEMVIRLKAENQIGFLQGIVDQFLQNPDFFSEALAIACSNYPSNSEEYRIAHFFAAASQSLGKTGQFDLNPTLSFFEQETRAGGIVTKIALRFHIEEINKGLRSEENQGKVQAAMATYQQWLRGDSLEEHKSVMNEVD